MAALSITDLFCVWVVVIAIAYDLVALWRFGLDGTISRRVVYWSHKHPAIPFALGFLAGHWFA